MYVALGIGLILFYIVSCYFFYGLGARNEARWWAKRIR